MKISSFPPALRELMAKNIILSSGGCFYPNNEDLRMTVNREDGTSSVEKVTCIVYVPGWPDGGTFVYFAQESAFPQTQEEKQKIWDFILKSTDYPDKELTDEESVKKMLHLRERNVAFIARHGDINEEDKTMIKEYQAFFEQSRKALGNTPIPMPCDIVEGAYYNGTHEFKNGLIETNPHFQHGLSVCAEPYVPFVYFRNQRQNEISLSVSGGPFFGIEPEDLEYIGPDTRFVCDWGHCGRCACGAIDFPVMVNRWRIKDGVEY